jgi:hypothetical protein
VLEHGSDPGAHLRLPRSAAIDLKLEAAESSVDVASSKPSRLRMCT